MGHGPHANEGPDVIKILIKTGSSSTLVVMEWNSPQSYRYFDDVRALVGMWAMAQPLFENLLNKGPFKIFFQKIHKYWPTHFQNAAEGPG